MSYSVLIVGAGPTGLTAAVELARQGIVPRIIDKRPSPSQLSRAVGILNRSMAILGPSGVAAQIKNEAINYTGIAFHRGAKRVAEFPLNFDDKTRLYGLPQDRTEQLLAQALHHYGGKVAYGTPFTTLAQDDNGVSVSLNGQIERFDYVFGADGVHSTVRDAIGVDFPGFDLPGQWSIADVESQDWPDPTLFQGFILPGTDVCVVAPLGPARFRVIASTPDALAALPVPMHVRNLRKSGTFTISVRQVTHYNVGRVFLGGDAAHCHSPVGGRGMNLGMADADGFVRRLLNGTLSGYHADRHAEGAHVLTFSERGRNIMQSSNPVLRRVVPYVMSTVSNIPPLARVAMRYFVSG